MTLIHFRNRDPWWDMEGDGVRRDRTRRRIVGGVAFAIAIVACGLTTAAWLQQLQPVIHQLGI
jgi:fructose-1,6-bisphosphatase/inositol monophosphatase family enzyme